MLVVATPRLTLRELREGPLRRVGERSAIGAMSARARHVRPDPAEGYVALGSGARTRSVRAARRGEVVRGRRRSHAGRASGRRGEVVRGRVLAIDALRAANSGARLSSGPGALGSALAAAGRDVVVTGDGPVALAAMDRASA